MIRGGVESDDDARDGAEVWREDGVSCGERCWSDGRGSFEDSSVDICGDIYCIYCQELCCFWALCRDTSSEAAFLSANLCNNLQCAHLTCPKISAPSIRGVALVP
jgi:hypothetical protein